MSVSLKPFQDEIVSQIEYRITNLVGWDVDYLESLIVVKYESGQFFGAHHDGIFRPYTVFLYLNDVPIGGETRFPNLGLKIRPRRGAAVVWQNTNTNDEGKNMEDTRLVHEALPPLDGYMKYGVNCFINEHIMRN